MRQSGLAYAFALPLTGYSSCVSNFEKPVEIALKIVTFTSLRLIGFLLMTTRTFIPLPPPEVEFCRVPLVSLLS